MTALPVLSAEDFSHAPDALADALSGCGACRILDWPDPSLRGDLRGELQRLQAAGALSRAAVGRRDGRVLRDDIRTDATLWLDDPRCAAPARTFLARMDEVRIALNRTLYLGLAECEAHYAAYPPGGGYARHRDRFRDSDARVVSWVSYLNDDDWREDDGGALRLHLHDGAVDVSPAGGSICFMSELEHEVLPSTRERLSIACWMRRHGRNPS